MRDPLDQFCHGWSINQHGRKELEAIRAAARREARLEAANLVDVAADTMEEADAEGALYTLAGVLRKLRRLAADIRARIDAAPSAEEPATGGDRA